MNYSFIIFDYDGTICDSHPAINYSLQYTFRTFNLPVPEMATISSVMETGIGIADTIINLHPEPVWNDAATLDKMVHTYRTIYLEEGDQHTLLFEGAQEVFRTLHASKVTLIVVSNKGIKAVEQSLTHFGLINDTDLVIADGLYPKGTMKMKPDPMIFREIIQPRYSFTKEDKGLMVGDTSADIQFARNCGIDACWAAYGYGNKKECMALQPAHAIHQFKEVLSLA
jgi:phosphoglycolate phosphatase